MEPAPPNFRWIYSLRMRNIRLIARLDIKGPNLIKGVHLEGLRVIGPPNKFAVDYYNQGADELIYMDSVASLYGRNHLNQIISSAAKDIFIPMTVGGGIRSVEDATEVLRSGADKVAVNTAAVHNPRLITDLAQKFGSQCVVLSIEAKKINSANWEVLTENGRQRTGFDVLNWAKKAEELGAGEILLTSVDNEGTKKGFDSDLVHSISNQVDIPVIASGGMGLLHHAANVIKFGNASAVAMAHVLHYRELDIKGVKDYLISQNIEIRKNV